MSFFYLNKTFFVKRQAQRTSREQSERTTNEVYVKRPPTSSQAISNPRSKQSLERSIFKDILKKRKL